MRVEEVEDSKLILIDERTKEKKVLECRANESQRYVKGTLLFRSKKPTLDTIASEKNDRGFARDYNMFLTHGEYQVKSVQIDKDKIGITWSKQTVEVKIEKVWRELLNIVMFASDKDDKLSFKDLTAEVHLGKVEEVWIHEEKLSKIHAHSKFKKDKWSSNSIVMGVNEKYTQTNKMENFLFELKGEIAANKYGTGSRVNFTRRNETHVSLKDISEYVNANIKSNPEVANENRKIQIAYKATAKAEAAEAAEEEAAAAAEAKAIADAVKTREEIAAEKEREEAKAAIAAKAASPEEKREKQEREEAASARAEAEKKKKQELKEAAAKLQEKEAEAAAAEKALQEQSENAPDDWEDDAESNS